MTNKRNPERQSIRREIAKIIREQRANQQPCHRRPMEFVSIDRLVVRDDLFDCDLFTSWQEQQRCDPENYYQVRIEHEDGEYGGFDYWFKLQKLTPVTDEQWLTQLLDDRYPTQTTVQKIYAITGAWCTDQQIEQLRSVL